MSMMTVAESLQEVLANFPEISLVYLFGSQVTGQIGPMSDYDLAIMVDSQNDESAIQSRFQHKMALGLKSARVDVVLLDRVPVDFAYHIISVGKLLYQKDVMTRVEFEARVLGLYGDYLPVLRAFKDQIIRGDAHAKRVQRYREALGRTQRTLGKARTP